MSYRIPKTLDNPLRCLGVPIDTLIVFFIIWSGFVLFEQGLYGLFVGIFGAFVFGRFRSRSIVRKSIRIMYWYLPAEMNFIKGVQGHQRKMSMRKWGRQEKWIKSSW